MPGEPAFEQQTQPPQAIPLDAVCGPRKPGPWARSSAASGVEEPAAKVQRYKAPPAHRIPVEAGPPPASNPGQPGHAAQSSSAASGTTSKSSGPKAPPPLLPGTAEHAAQSAAQPARLPAGMLATQAAAAVPAKPQHAAKQETAAEEPKPVVTPAPKQLAAVAEAAKVFVAHGFTLTHEQKVALEAQAKAEAATEPAAPKQWAGYRPGALQAGAGDRSGAASASSWQQTEWAPTPDETGYGPASEYHPYHRQYQEGQRGWNRQPRSWQYVPSDEGNKSRPGGPDRRSRGDQRRDRKETRYLLRDLFVDSNPEEVRIWGNEDKNSAIGRPGAKALATGDWQKAGKTLRDTERVFIKFMQNSGRLVTDKRAFGYRPSLRQLGRLRAFIDHQVDFTKFADVIWGDSDGETNFPVAPAWAPQASGAPKPAPAGTAEQLEEVVRATDLFNSRKPRAAAARALLEQAKFKTEMADLLKEESSEEGFHDSRDEVEQPGLPVDVATDVSGVPTVEEAEAQAFEDVEEFRPSLEDELLSRAQQAVASERASASDRIQDEADFDNDSDL
eukprot:4966797-Amphidinium_carterae.1